MGNDTHPHAEWSAARIAEMVGTTETLTLEFKSYRSLVADDKKDKNAKITEAARDIAAMANEQGGVIVYGLEVSKSGQRRFATAVEGFGPQHSEVSREWFLQFIRDRVHPPLATIDAVEVPLEDEHYALVVLVPQARGVARQTDDHLFWRRDAQGIHPMTVQEIEDVRHREEHPTLQLSTVVVTPSSTTSGTYELRVQFRVRNVSSVTANFAVVTVVGAREVGINFLSNPEWSRVESDQYHHVVRCSLAQGSVSRWSPITPGFTAALQELRVTFGAQEQEDRRRSRAIGYARVDYEGGAQLYRMMFWIPSGFDVSLEPYTPGAFWANAVHDLLRVDAG